MLFNLEISETFVTRVQPLFDDMATKGEAFKIKKDALFDQFASRGVSGSVFRQMYNALNELKGKKRTLKSVSEQFPCIPKKQIQELSKILTQDEPETLDLLDQYQKAQQAVLQEADKVYNIYARHLPKRDVDLDDAYEQVKERVYALDDEVRAGLKGLKLRGKLAKSAYNGTINLERENTLRKTYEKNFAHYASCRLQGLVNPAEIPYSRDTAPDSAGGKSGANPAVS